MIVASYPQICIAFLRAMRAKESSCSVSFRFCHIIIVGQLCFFFKLDFKELLKQLIIVK